jgi:hypothetical protein
MAVGIHGQGDLAVPEDLHHDARRHTLSDQETRRRMAQVVQPDGGQPGFAKQLLELPVVIARIHRS